MQGLFIDRGENLRVWLPAVFGLSARAIALITAILILIVFGDRSEAEKVFAVVLATGLLAGVILSIVIGIRRRRAIGRL
jgi:uncharacterized membrane protein HdeD (DUF308 family)